MSVAIHASTRPLSSCVYIYILSLHTCKSNRWDLHKLQRKCQKTSILLQFMTWHDTQIEHRASCMSRPFSYTLREVPPEQWTCIFAGQMMGRRGSLLCPLQSLAPQQGSTNMPPTTPTHATRTRQMPLPMSSHFLFHRLVLHSSPGCSGL